MSRDPANALTLVFSRAYDLGLCGLERLHPFDARKYGRAWRELEARFGAALATLCEAPASPATDSLLRRVHSEAYLRELRTPSYLERALELPCLRYVPGFLLRRALVRPMRWAVTGTMLAAQRALGSRAAVNLSGGYHHASPERGEGFCLFADVPIAIAELRASRLIEPGQVLGIIDLDAHQGNGFARCCLGDPDVVILDVYNREIFPNDDIASRRVDVDVPLAARTRDDAYLTAVERGLAAFFAKAGRQPRLVFYNAGSDILDLDRLGGMSVSAEGVFRRDQMVFEALLDRQIPFVMVPSGGYSKGSYLLIARSVGWLIEQVGGLAPTAGG